MADLDEKRVIEAALFISGKELTIEDFRRLTGIAALGYIQNIVNSLKKEYEEKGSSIEISEADGKYSMRIKNEYIERVKQFAQDSEISKSALRTLAFIAKHDGILKSDLVKKIGTRVYEDVKELVQNGFVKTHKAGRTSKLNVTGKFRTYFGDVSRFKAAAMQPVQTEQEPQQSAQTTIVEQITAEAQENTSEAAEEEMKQ
jgi:segregation and condensation protein B